MKTRRLLESAAALTLGFCAPGLADLITINLGVSNEDATFIGSKSEKDVIEFTFGAGGFPSLTGKATSIKQVAGKADQKDEANYVLRYLNGVTLNLRHGKDQDKDTWTVEQTGSARFIQFCYAKIVPGHCTRRPDPPALLESTFNLMTFKQNPADKDGKGVFNFDMAENLLFFNNPDKGQKNVGGKLLEGSPQFIPPGVLTLTVNLGKGFDLNTIAGADKSKSAKVASGEAKIKDQKPAAPAGKEEKKGPAMSKGKSAFYDAAESRLSIRDDRITETGFAGDPILDAAVNLPDLFLAGALDDIYVFVAQEDAAFDISQGLSPFVEAQLPVLYYDAANNSFFGELTESTFASLGSPWVAQMSDLLDRGAAGFDPQRKFWFTYAPDENLFDLTDGFSIDGFSSGTNSLFADRAALVPEPAALALVVTGLLGFGILKYRGTGTRATHGTPLWCRRNRLLGFDAPFRSKSRRPNPVVSVYP